MESMKYLDEAPFAVTVCDEKGVIVYMNEKSKTTFASYGGGALVGSSLSDCHPEAARNKLLTLLKEQKSNAYTIEKNGKRKMIYQSPWYVAGAFAGLVEISLELPDELPHFRRS